MNREGADPVAERKKNKKGKGGATRFSSSQDQAGIKLAISSLIIERKREKGKSSLLLVPWHSRGKGGRNHDQPNEKRKKKKKKNSTPERQTRKRN